MSIINSVIDIYHGDDVTSFSDVAGDGILGILHKATQGSNYTDPAYAARKQQVLDAGMMWGAYHFGSSTESGSAQAEYFLSVVKPGPSDLLALDFESDGDTTMTLQQAVDFVETIQKETGKYPGFYSGSLIKEDMGDEHSAILSQCWFWLSEYGPEAKLPPTWSYWTMWQYTDGDVGPEPHTVAGINGGVDRDKFNGTEEQLKALWGY